MIKEFKFLLILFVLIDHNQVFGEGMLIDDMRNIEGEPQGEYCENDTTKWCLITDRVMGGVSEGDLCVNKTDKGFYLSLTGDVSTENNGGFIQARTKITNHPNDKQFLGVRIKVRGNGEEYSIHLRTKYLLFPWQYYYSTFTATAQWETIDLKFSEFQKSNFSQF